MDEVIMKMIGECLRVAQALTQSPGVFRITNGHARKAELCSKALEISKSLPYSTSSETTITRHLQEFKELLGRVSLADGRCYALRVSGVCQRFLYSVEEAVINQDGSLARPGMLDFLPLSAWQIVTKEWETAMLHLKDSIKELSPSSDNDEKKIVSLLKGVKTVMRKIRTKCLQPLIEPVETKEGIAWLDDLLDALTPLMKAVEGVTVAAFPPENPVQVAAFASEVVVLAQVLCQVARAYPGNPTTSRPKSPLYHNACGGLEEEELAWFENAQSHFDHLLGPILETFPIR